MSEPPADKLTVPADLWNRAIEIMEEARIELHSRTDAANAARHRAAERHRARARELQAAGLSVPRIGLRMAREDDRPDSPYPETTVRRWLRKG